MDLLAKMSSLNVGGVKLKMILVMIELQETAFSHTYSVYREALCFISAYLAQFDLLAGCAVAVE